MPLADERMKLVFAQVGNIGEQRGRAVVQDASGDDPAHMRPKTAIARRMRVPLYVSILVMNAMRCHPEKRPAFQRQRGADGKKVLHPLIRLESAMSQQPVIAHPDAEAAGNPPQQHGHKQRLPGKHEERRDCAYMKCHHKKSGEFADRLTKRAITFEQFHEYVLPWWWIRAQAKTFDS